MLRFQEEKEAALKQGLLAVERYDDVLGKSLPNPEHPGRVRGVGGLVPIKKTYGNIKRRGGPTSSRSEAEFDAKVDEKVEERCRGMAERLREQMREEMKSELAIMLQQHLGQQQMTHSPTLLQSSCQSVQPRVDLSGFTEVMKIHILVCLCLSFIHIKILLYFPLHVIPIILFE
jgi:hypothetical protein